MLDKINKPAFWIALLGAVKLITNSFGWSIISDQQVNDIANGIAAIATVVGVIIDHGKPPAPPAVLSDPTQQ